MNAVTVIRSYAVAFMVAMLFVAYMSFTQPMPTRKPDVQQILNSQVPHALPGPPPRAAPVEKGRALAYMTIPRFGDDWLWTVLEGTNMETINKGPAHFTGTALPGEEGNSAWAAHRSTHGDPFLDFDKLEIGDEVIISQPGSEWVYEVTTSPKVIDSDAGWVLGSFEPGKWLTLTTCWPKYGSEKRMYVRAKLTE